MKFSLEKISQACKYTLHGFDRIVFKGCLLPIMFADGAQNFLRRVGVLNKDFKSWMMAQTETIVHAAEQFAEQHRLAPIRPIPSCDIRKEELAHQQQQERRIEHGPIGVYSAVESCRSFKARFDPQASRPKLCAERTKCKHLYFYQDHQDYGFLNVRLQTWFPYNIQFCLNGREWLRRALEREAIPFIRKGNKLLHVEDFARAQALLTAQLDTDWGELLDGLRREVFPDMARILGPHLGYYWTLWQSEWASDLIFERPEDLGGVTQNLLKHAFMSAAPERVLRYLDRPLTKRDQPYANFSQEVMTRFLQFNDGCRVRHWVGGNSAKIYTEQNVLRLETTINAPDMFKVHRHKQGAGADEPKQRLPLRKGVADTALRAIVSQEVNERVLANVLTMQDKEPLARLLDEVCPGKTRDGRRVRGLDPTGKDRAILQALADQRFAVGGITNKGLRELLRGQPEHRGRSEQQLAGYVSRQLRRLRDHGLLRKLPRQNRYHLSERGRKLTLAAIALRKASINELMELAA